MCERHPNTDRARRSCKFICKSGKKKWKQNGKRTFTMNQNNNVRNRLSPTLTAKLEARTAVVGAI
eukprot:1135055-Heterocapsa_arctica.AAC.1